MARQPKGPQAITANRLLDGRVVYLTAGGGWSETVDDAVVVAPEEADALLHSARADVVRAHVIEPYLIEVGANGHPVPRRYRETIRARGPSVRLDHGKQAGSP